MDSGSVEPRRALNRPDQQPGGQVAEYEAEPDAPEERHCDDGGAEQRDDFDELARRGFDSFHGHLACLSSGGGGGRGVAFALGPVFGVAHLGAHLATTSTPRPDAVRMFPPGGGGARESRGESTRSGRCSIETTSPKWLVLAHVPCSRRSAALTSTGSPLPTATWIYEARSCSRSEHCSASARLRETVTIEDKSRIDLDFVAHDLRKFARMLTNHNGYVLEAALPPLVVLTTPLCQELRELGRGCVTRPTVRHYQGVRARAAATLARAGADREAPPLCVPRPAFGDAPDAAPARSRRTSAR